MIIRAWLGPLVVTFLIVLFILVMQFLWKYVDDLMGKGLEWHVLAELLMYATASFVPLALPLGVLLSSIMTMGALGENTELVPMRSAGLHLFRIMLPLIVMSLLLATASFLFSNHVLPVANLKFQSLLWDVTQKKPALNLVPNVFYNGIKDHSIRVREKDPRTGELTDVLIYDHSKAFKGEQTMVRAERGRMSRSTDGRYLVLTLENGHFYDDRSPAGSDATRPMLRGTFTRDVLRLDLSGLGLDRTDEDLFRDHYKMLTLGQLQHAEDSLSGHFAERSAEQEQYLRDLLYMTRQGTAPGAEGRYEPFRAKMSGFTPEVRANLYEVAINLSRNAINFLDRTIEERGTREEQLARFRIEWHRKLMLAAACIIFFFIGAPLGAIIRKGGMGLPTVFAIVFFLVFHVISFSTEKLIIAGGLQAWPGMWVSSIVLLPVGMFLTWKATTDSPLMERDAYYRAVDRLRARFRRHADPPALQ